MLLCKTSYASSVAITYHHFFFFNDTATTEIYTLSLHDALPILGCLQRHLHISPRIDKNGHFRELVAYRNRLHIRSRDRKSTRLNSSHANISYAVFCLKKKKIQRFVTRHGEIGVRDGRTYVEPMD